jgi:hypothetical protein
MSIRPKPKLVVLAVIVAVVLLGLASGAYFLWQKYSSPIPASIRPEITFPIFYPSNASVKVNRSTIEYDKSGQVLSFSGNTLTGSHTKLIFSEEPTPDPFNDITGYYSALLNDMNEYDDFSTINGTVYLTTPKNLNGNQSAVMNTEGNLMFIRADGDLATNTWETIFNGLNIVVK